MPKLVPIHWKKFDKFLKYMGCTFEREEGDHRIYWRDDLTRPIVVVKETAIPKFIIRSNLRTLGMSTTEYLRILEQL